MSSTTTKSPKQPVVLCQRIDLSESSKKVIIVSIHRPDELNCFNSQVTQSLANIFSDIATTSDDDLAAVIFTGSGTSFCAGADLSDPPNPLVQSSDLPKCLKMNPIYQMSRVQVPIIGALHGHVITGGFELALACDILVGDATTNFRDTHVKFGVAPCWGLSQKLQRKIGPGRAKLISFTAQPIEAKLAYEWGLLDDLVSSGQTSLDRAMELAKRIANHNGLMVQRYKKALEEGGAMNLANGLQRERQVGLAHYLEVLNDGEIFQNAKKYITDETRPRSRHFQSKL